MKYLLSTLGGFAMLAFAMQTPSPDAVPPAISSLPQLLKGAALPTSCASDIFLLEFPAIQSMSIYLCDAGTDHYYAPVLVQPLAGSTGFVLPSLKK